MLISLAPPPLALLDGAGEICSRDGVSGAGELCQRSSLGMVDPASIIGSVLGPVSAFFSAKEQTKQVKKQVALEQQRLKAEKEEAARQFALQQAAAVKEPMESHIMDQKLALVAIGGVALLVAGIFLVSTVKMAKEKK